MNSLRLLIDLPASGAWNMAVDEALLHSAAESKYSAAESKYSAAESKHSASESDQPTLRLYQWSEPTLSLGYFQNAADRAQHPPSADCPLVRRASGGGAILHDRELTYSLIFPNCPRADFVNRLYELVHAAWIEALASLGVKASQYRNSANCATESRQGPEPFLCFQRRTCFDVVCHGGKVVGSAQRRRRSAVLQHGSILLAASPYAPELPGIAELTGQRIAPEQLSQRLIPSLAAALTVTTRQGGLTLTERRLAERMAAERFASNEHAERR